MSKEFQCLIMVSKHKYVVPMISHAERDFAMTSQTKGT